MYDKAYAINGSIDLGLHVYVPRNRYDSPHGSPESLNAARMAASRLNATMIDATLIAEAEDAGFRPADPVTSDGVNWSFDVTGTYSIEYIYIIVHNLEPYLGGKWDLIMYIYSTE